MAVLSTTRNNGALLAVLLFGQLLLMSASVRGADGASVLESWCMRLSAPFVSAGRMVGGGVGGVTGGVQELFGARARNAQLEREVQRLAGELQQREEAAHENARLRQLLEMRENVGLHAVGASVVLAVLDEHTRMIVVDRGTADGVQPAAAVLAWGGVIGRVVAVGPHHAKVWLVTDPMSAVAGMIQRSRVEGMVQGRGTSGLVLNYVPTYADVMHGDRVVTRGNDGMFPRGLGLGTVVKVERSAEGIQTLVLEPALDLAAVEDVLIVLDRIPVIEEPL